MDNTATIWVIDDDRSIRWVLERALKQAQMDVRSFDNADDALHALERSQPDAIITDIRMPGMSGLDLLAEIAARRPQLPVIIMTAHSDLDSAVSAYQGGAFEYLPKPFDVDEAVELARRAVAHRIDQERGHGAEPSSPVPEIIGAAPSMQEVFRAIGRLSRSNITVLINGESGTGKELVAHALHRHSPRAAKPFIAINTAAIPRDLLESELFGHERGAFTGAQSQRMGRFEQANGGTLFLDEIGDLSLALQPKLLRAIETQTFRRIGSQKETQVDVRFVAATHRDLSAMVTQGSFRQDLYYRLNVGTIEAPPLRERAADIVALADFFLARFAPTVGCCAVRLSEVVQQALAAYRWPGNVRELRNVIERALILCNGESVQLSQLPREISAGVEAVLSPADQALASDEDLLLSTVEQRHIQRVLQLCRGNKTRAADLLGISRLTLRNRLGAIELPDEA